MHPLTRAVLTEARRLEFAQFQQPENREQINEIRKLALEQISEDVDTSAGDHRDRVGRDWVNHVGPEDSAEALWKRWTPEQQALEAGLVPFLTRLPRQQREVLHLRYWGQLSQHQVAAVLQLERRTIRTHEERALLALRNELATAFLPEQEEEAV